MDPIQNDDIQVDASSASTTSEGADSQTDVNQEASSSTSQNTTEQPKTLMETVKAVLAKSETKSDTDGEEEGKVEAEKSATGTDSKDPQTETKGPIPYERFAEVNQAKVSLEQQLEEYKPMAEMAKGWTEWLQTNNIQPDEFSYWMNVAAAMKNNPTEALKLLGPHLQTLQSFKGDVLTPELQKAVDDGEMNLEWAKKLMATQTQGTLRQQQAEAANKQQERQKAQQTALQVQQSLANWESSKASSDPDFKQKKSDAEPDGKYELVMAKYAIEVQKARTPADFVSAAERAYAAVDTSLKRYNQPTRKASQNVKSTSSTVTNRVTSQPKTALEAVKQRLANRAAA